MPEAKIVQIADALVAELNAGTFSQEVHAERAYVPTFDLKDMKDLQVTVVPKSKAEALLGRSSDRVDYTIDIGIQKKMATVAEGDGLMALVREISDFLNRRALEAAADVTWIGTVNDPIFSPEHAEKLRQFTSVLSVTYRAIE